VVTSTSKLIGPKKNVTKMENDTEIKLSRMLVDEEEEITAFRRVEKYLAVDTP
jgi:hypothetical protein